MTEKSYLLFGTKIYNHTTKEIGLLIYTWGNEFSDGNVDVLALLHAHVVSPSRLCLYRLNSFAIRTRFALSVRKSASRLVLTKEVNATKHLLKI